MRLGKAHLELIDGVAKQALAGECVITIPAPTWHVAKRIFEAAKPHMEERGAKSLSLGWQFVNGSRVNVRAAA